MEGGYTTLSRKIDENVVEMRFENGQFERAAKTSLNTIEKLKTSLKFKGVEKGFEEVAESTKRIDFSVLERGIDTVKSKFSALEIMGVTALANITNSAVNTGKRIVSSLSVDQVTAGWGKLEQKTTSVATLISQRYDMDTVEKQLSRLNWYTDETSYNFTAMADSISKFTASGKKLDESTTALMGIANWAALSGQNATTASRAMYQLSQAMGAGVMRKQDYMSIQNASMDTDEFRQKALDAAVALGTLKKNADGTYKSLANATSSSFSKSQFAEHLTQDAWFTSDVMMKVFTDYSAAVDQIYEYSNEKGITASEAIEELGDKVDEFGLKAFRAAQEAKTWTDVLDSVKDAVSTGWMNSFEAIFGNYEEQRVLWTDLANAMYDVFAASAEGRNELLGGWKELGGRTALIEGFWNVWNNITDVLDTVKETFREIFPQTTAEQLLKITEGIRDFTAKLTLNEERTQKLKTALRGLFSVIKIIFSVLKTSVKFVYSLAKNLSWIADVALDAAAAIGEWLGGVSKSAEKSGIFAKILGEVGNVLTFILNKVKSVVDAVRALNWNWLTSVCGAAAEAIRWVLKNVSDLYTALKVKLGSPELKSLGEKMVGVLEWIYEQIKSVFSAIGGLFSSSGFNSVSGAIGKIYNFLVKLGSIVVSVGKKIGTALGEAFRNGDISNILDIVNGGLFASILYGIKKVTSGVADAIGNFTGAFGEVRDILGAVKDSLEVWQKNIQAGAILKIAQAIAVLAASLLVLSLIDSNKLTGALTAMTLMFAKLALSLKILGKSGFAFSGITRMCAFMVSLSASVLILSAAMKKLGSLDWNGIAKGVAGITALTAAVTLAAKSLSKIDGKIIKGANSLIIFSSAIAILSSIAKTLAALDLPKLIQGMAGVSALAFMMTAVAKSLSKIDGKIVKGASSLIIFASAVGIMASVCKSLSKIDLGSLIKGAAGLAAVSVIALIAAKSLSKIDGRIVKGATSLVIFSTAVAILAKVCKNLSGLRWDELTKGLVGIAGITAALVAVSKAASKVTKSAVSFVILGASLAIISEVINKLGEMNTGKLAVGFTAFAGSLITLAIGLKAMKGAASGAAALAVAAAAIAPLTLELKVLSTIKMGGIVKALVALAGTFIVLRIAVKSLKPIVGTMTKVAGAVALFGTGCALAGAGVLAVSVALTSLAVSLTAVGTSIGVVLSNLFDGLSDSAASFGKMAGEITKALCTALAETAPVLAETLLSVILAVLRSLADDVPQIVDTLADIITTTLDKLAVKIPKIIESLTNVLQQTAAALNKTLGKEGWKKLLLSVTAISGVMLAIAATAKIISSIKLNGMAKGLGGLALAVAGIIGILTAVGLLAQIPGLDKILGDSARIFTQIGNVIGSLVSGLINGLVENFPKDFSAILNACAGIEVIALAISPLAGILGKLDIKGTAKGMAGFAIIVGGLTAILAVLAGLNQIPGFEDFISGGGDILCKIAEILGKTIGTFVDNLAKSVNSEIGEVVNSLVSVGTIISAVAVVAKIVGKLKIDPTSVAMGFAGVAVAIGCIAVILTALGALKQIPGLEWIVGEGGEFLCKIGSILGEFVGSIISGLGVGLTSGLQKIGQNLSEFIVAVTPFIEGVKQIDDRVMQGVLTLSGAILALTAANLLDGIASFLMGGRSISKFGEEIGDFGASLKIFSDNVTGINTPAVEAATKAGMLLAEMTHTIPNRDGVAQFFAGSQNLAKFSDEIGDFGTGISEFSKKVTDVNVNKVEAASKAGMLLAEMTHTIPNRDGVAQFFAGSQNLAKFSDEIGIFGKGISQFSKNSSSANPERAKTAAEVGKILAEMTNTLPNENGVAQFFAGSNSLASFSDGIGKFGAGISVFAENVSGMPDNTAKVEAAANAGKVLAEMTNTLPNEDGLAQFFSGKKSLASFSEGIGAFGEGITAFAKTVESMPDDTTKVTAAANAGKVLAEMTNTLPNEKGLEQWFSGEKSLASFSEGICTLGNALTEFSNSVKDVDVDKTEAATQAATAIAEMYNILPAMDGVAQFFAGNPDLDKFGTALGNLGDSVLTFSTKVADIDNDSVKTAAEATKSIAEALTVDNPDTNLGAFLQGSAIGLSVFVNKMDELDTYGASAKLTNLAAVGEKIQNGGFDGFNNLSEALTNAALDGVQAYADAFSDADSTAQTAVSNFAKKAASGIESAKPKYTEVGLMMTKGFAEGMASGTGYLNSAAANLAKEALETLKRVLDIHSPSKETFKMGSWFDAGFADGILNNSGQVEDAGATVGEKAKSGLNGVISKITDYIGGKIDVQPTITPVLDLSSVETQSKSIDAMFSREQAISVNAGIAANTASSNTTSSSSSNFTFTQNITSPKAVDAKTIYRQTRNQFSRMMGAIRQV